MHYCRSSLRSPAQGGPPSPTQSSGREVGGKNGIAKNKNQDKHCCLTLHKRKYLLTLGKNKGRLVMSYLFVPSIFCLPSTSSQAPSPGGGRLSCRDCTKACWPALYFWLAPSHWELCRAWRKQGLCPEGSPWAGCILPPKASEPITLLPLLLGSGA